MKKRISIRVMVECLASIIAGCGVLWFTTPRAEKFIHDIPYEDGEVKTNLKIAGIGVAQGTIICMVQIATVYIIDKLFRKIQNK